MGEKSKGWEGDMEEKGVMRTSMSGRRLRRDVRGMGEKEEGRGRGELCTETNIIIYI
jgi:hypothetical protein